RAEHYSKLAQVLLYGTCAVALVLGLYGRFKGLGSASMAADEYYIARSVENVLRVGVPEYLCGGYYPRALIFQYAVALLASSGMDVELAARLIASVASVVALPAAFLLGRRVGGPAVGLAAVAILAVSVWEVEVARFGRMYAPFQAVFLWYLVYFVKLTVDRQRSALWPLLALTVLGVLTWEGGAFLALASLLAPFVNNSRGRLSQAEVLFLALNVVVFIGIFALTFANLRLAGTGEPQFPDNFDVDAAREVSLAALGIVDDTRPLWRTLSAHFGWMIIALVPVLLALNAVRYLWRIRAQWPVALGLLLALVLGLFQQFAACGAVLLLLPLLGLLPAREFASGPGRHVLLAIAATAVFWVAFGLMTSDWRQGVATTWLGHNHFVWLAYELTRFPNLLLQVVRPWSRSVPILGVGLALLFALALWRVLRQGEQAAVERALLLTTVCLLALVGMSEPPRQETRYVFFLYPVFIILGLGAAVHAARAIGRTWGTGAEVIGVLALAALFMLTEDFQPRHLLNTGTMAANVRADLPEKLETHVVGRTDVRGAAQWLSAHAVSGRTLVVNAFPTADYYYKHFDFTYIDESSPRFRAYACRRGTLERWGNLPLVHSMPQLDSRIAAAGGAFMVIGDRNADQFTSALARWNPRIVWTAPDAEIQILAFGAP
ncbi:MAG: glycosyltransferase family 39 protein, partial [Gammaproteobacteria bacterium]